MSLKNINITTYCLATLATITKVFMMTNHVHGRKYMSLLSLSLFLISFITTLYILWKSRTEHERFFSFTSACVIGGILMMTGYIFNLLHMTFGKYVVVTGLIAIGVGFSAMIITRLMPDKKEP